jgi:hypothetical protein
VHHLGKADEVLDVQCFATVGDDRSREPPEDLVLVGRDEPEIRLRRTIDERHERHLETPVMAAEAPVARIKRARRQVKRR